MPSRIIRGRSTKKESKTARTASYMVAVFCAMALPFALMNKGDVAAQLGQPLLMTEIQHQAGDSVSLPYKPGELIVKFRSETPSSLIGALHTQIKAQSLRSYPTTHLEHIKLPDGMKVEDAIAQYQNNPAVEYAEPNYIRYFYAIPNDPLFANGTGNLWGLNNVGQTVESAAGTPDADIDAPEAWDITTGSPNVVIAVIDSGIAYDHPDLAPNIWTNPGEIAGNGIDDDGNGFVDDIRGWDFTMNDNDPMDAVDINPRVSGWFPGNGGHGTHVAGTIAAAGNNGIGTTGVMWTAKLMPLRIGMVITSVIDSANAISYAINNGAKIINASYGGPGCSLTEYNALAAANQAGVLFVAAAGNGGVDGNGDNNDVSPNFPSNFSITTNCDGRLFAALPNIIAVAAVNSNDELTDFSNFGPTSVQIAAPGQSIFSTRPSSNIVTVLTESFDGAFAGWLTGGTANWALTNTASFSAPNSLTDSVAGNYANNANSTLTSPAFSTVGRRGCRFDARIRASFAPNDGVAFGSSTDGINFVEFTSLVGTTNGAFPLLTLGDVPDGKPAARVRFHLLSDASGVNDGVYVDNVRVYCVSGVPLATDAQFLDGTSMATPHVVGVAGLLLAAKPTLTVAQLRDAILNTGDAKATLAGKISTGKRINARAALVSVLNNYGVTVSKAGSGGGTVTSNPPALNCGSTCSAQFALGTSTTLSAVPDGNSTFGGWSGGGCSGTGTCIVNTDTTVTATFTANPAPPSGASAPSDGGGGGGCTLGSPNTADVVLPALLLLSFGLWAWRLKRSRFRD